MPKEVRDQWRPTELCRFREEMTYPPLKAPTGFRTGSGVFTSASLREDEAKLRDVFKTVEGEGRLRNAGVKTRGSIVVVLVEEGTILRMVSCY